MMDSVVVNIINQVSEILFRSNFQSSKRGFEQATMMGMIFIIGLGISIEKM
jgi:hypothetical protein